MRTRMKYAGFRVGRLLSAFWMVVASCSLWGQSPLHISQAYVVNPRVASLCWNDISHAFPGDSSLQYHLYRRLPDQNDYSIVMSVSDTAFLDTLRVTICADTVSYFVEAHDTFSDTVNLFFQDNVPTSPCTLHLCSVDTTLRRLRLSWYPSPDPDVMGYYICMGSPCRNYDTVWGRLNNTYLCDESLDLAQGHDFRILAFDSCYQASPLTPYYHNPVLTLYADACSRQLHFSWNQYVNMPDSVTRYRVCYRLNNQDAFHTFLAGPDGPFSFDTLLPDLSVSQVYAYLSVENDSLSAYSVPVNFHFVYGDTARYVRISSLSYDDGVPAVTLSIDVDPYFYGRRCYVYRSDGCGGPFLQIAELSRLGTPPVETLTYVDTDINRAASSYCYQVGVPDICNQWVKYSDIERLDLPEVLPPAAFFPNVIRYGDADNGLFCPQYFSPLTDGYSLDIYNRFGQRLFHTTTITDCWDGTDFSGTPLPQGVYVYQVRCRYADGSTKVYKGTIMLVK